MQARPIEAGQDAEMVQLRDETLEDYGGIMEGYDLEMSVRLCLRDGASGRQPKEASMTSMASIISASEGIHPLQKPTGDLAAVYRGLTGRGLAQVVSRNGHLRAREAWTSTFSSVISTWFGIGFQQFTFRVVVSCCAQMGGGKPPKDETVGTICRSRVAATTHRVRRGPQLTACLKSPPPPLCRRMDNQRGSSMVV